MKKLLFIFMLCSERVVLFSQPPALVGVPSNNLTSGNTVKQYEKFEIDLILDRKVTNIPGAYTYQTPHDSAEVSLYAVFTKRGSSSASFKIHLFYNELFTERNDPCIWPTYKKPDAMFPNSDFYAGTSKNSSNANSSNNYFQSWKMRCAFKEAGTYDYVIFAKDKYSPGVYTQLYADTIIVVENPSAKGFVKRNEDNNTYLFFSNGEMCFLNGVNEFFAENKSTFICRMRGLIDKMTANNINFMRMWIDGNPGWYYTADLQGAALDQDYYTSIFNQESAKILDEVFDYARSKNMYIQPCLLAPNLSDAGWNHGYSYHFAYNKDNKKHGTKRYNTPNVGEITNPWEFYRTPDILNYLKNYLKYCTSRWGYATNIVGWEIGNEINCTASELKIMDVKSAKNWPDNLISFPQPPDFSTQIISWHSKVKMYLNYYDAHKHLVTTSAVSEAPRTGMKRHPLSNEAFNIMSAMDYSNSHNYYINPTCQEYKLKPCARTEEQEDANFNTSIVYRDELSKPTQVQEWGFGDDGCIAGTEGYYEMDPFGFSHHNVVLSSAFAGSFGTACTFNTWSYVHPRDLYYHYKGIGTFMNSFGNLGNPLYIIKKRTQFDNMGNTDCTNTDFSEEGLRVYFMASSDQLVLGWCQDKRFSFPRLYWRNKDYLKTLEKRYKPSTENSSNGFILKVPKKGFYKVKWNHPLDIKKFIINDTVSRSFTLPGSNNEYVAMHLPKSLHNDRFADGLFSASYICEPKLTFRLMEGPSYHYGDKVVFTVDEFVGMDEVEIIVEKVNGQGIFIGELFKRKLSAIEFMDDSKRELNYLYNLVNPFKHALPYIDNQVTYYRLRINSPNPNGLSQCIPLNSAPIYFNFIGCDSKPMLKVNSIDSSTLAKPVVVHHGEPITLDGSGSYGGAGYRIIIKEVDTAGNLIGVEYNALYEGAFDHVINAHDVVKKATNGRKNYLPSDGPDHCRLYQIFHVNFNSYAPYKGCSSWESTLEYVKVICTADLKMDIVGGGNGPIKEFAYAEPVYLDGQKSTGETGYRVIIQQTDVAGNDIGNELNKLFSGPIDRLIDLNSIIKELSGGVNNYLLPDKNGPAYYKISLVIFNGYGDGGCEEWMSESRIISITSCHVDLHFTVNSKSGGNSFSDPYTFIYGNSLKLDGLETRGETAYRIILVRYNSAGQRLNEYNSLYEHSLSNIYNLNEWYKQLVDPSADNLPAYDGNAQNIWQLTLAAFNAYYNKGCDDWVEKQLFFKLEYDLKCPFFLNMSDSLNHNTIVTELCDNEGTFLNPYTMEYGGDQYTITMAQVELASWQFPATYVTYERHIKETQARYFDRKETSETFESSAINNIDLEEFWYTRTGYKIDKTKYYKVTLVAMNNSGTSNDYWIFKYKHCKVPSPFKDDLIKAPVSVTKSATLSLNDDELHITEVTVYPNPTNSSVTIQMDKRPTDDAEIVVTDLCSKTMYIGLHNENNPVIDLSAFSSGVYFIKVTVSKTLYNFKVIKL